MPRRTNIGMIWNTMIWGMIIMLFLLSNGGVRDHLGAKNTGHHIIDRQFGGTVHAGKETRVARLTTPATTCMLCVKPAEIGSGSTACTAWPDARAEQVGHPKFSTSFMLPMALSHHHLAKASCPTSRNEQEGPGKEHRLEMREAKAHMMGNPTYNRYLEQPDCMMNKGSHVNPTTWVNDHLLIRWNSHRKSGKCGTTFATIFSHNTHQREVYKRKQQRSCRSSSHGWIRPRLHRRTCERHNQLSGNWAIGVTYYSNSWTNFKQGRKNCSARSRTWMTNLRQLSKFSSRPQQLIAPTFYVPSYLIQMSQNSKNCQLMTSSSLETSHGCKPFLGKLAPHCLKDSATGFKSSSRTQNSPTCLLSVGDKIAVMTEPHETGKMLLCTATTKQTQMQNFPSARHNQYQGFSTVFETTDASADGDIFPGYPPRQERLEPSVPLNRWTVQSRNLHKRRLGTTTLARRLSGALLKSSLPTLLLGPQPLRNFSKRHPNTRCFWLNISKPRWGNLNVTFRLQATMF